MRCQRWAPVDVESVLRSPPSRLELGSPPSGQEGAHGNRALAVGELVPDMRQPRHGDAGAARAVIYRCGWRRRGQPVNVAWPETQKCPETDWSVRGSGDEVKRFLGARSCPVSLSRLITDLSR